MNEGLASFMEYKCLEAVLPQLPAQALFQLAASPTGTDFWSSQLRVNLHPTASQHFFC